MRYAILLTSYNTAEREVMYNDVIEWWKKNSVIDIYIVDSGNRKFKDSIEQYAPRIKIHHFDQFKHINPPSDTTTLEILSLEQAYEHFKESFSNYDYVIKITCKYTLPDLTSALEKIQIENGIDMILQFRGHNTYQNTELVGMRVNKMNEFLDKMKKEKGVLEFRISKISKNYKHVKLPKMKNMSNYKRAWGDILKYL